MPHRDGGVTLLTILESQSLSLPPPNNGKSNTHGQFLNVGGNQIQHETQGRIFIERGSSR